jgi:hypothetical protein
LKTWSRAVALLAISLLAVASTAGSATSLDLFRSLAAPAWAPAGTATIHPGVQTFSESGQCTANFVFYDGVDVYIGQAAHCTGTGAANETNGCETGVLPVGTPVEVSGATNLGTIAYNSWETMQSVSESDLNTCLGNDFALIRLAPADHALVNPSVPFWGGPRGLDANAPLSEVVYSYGNSSLRLGLEDLSPKTGVSTGDQSGGWSHNVYVVTPGIPGDSGSAFLGSGGGALGVLSTVSVTLSNQVSDLSRALNYMKAHTNFDAVELADGTEPFSPLL